MGAVYEVQDRKRDERVALKTLHELEPESLYRFKHEFRGLADLSHANLAALFELFASDDGWYFTMELVRGVSLLDWVRDTPALTVAGPPSSQVRLQLPARSTARTDDVTAIVTPHAGAQGDAPVSQRIEGPPATFDEERIRRAFTGLARGLGALHAGDRVHRDVKPSNVMVTKEGRVVVLDFGIMGRLGRHGGLDDRIVGTPSYMAPEQSRPGARPAPANDWYSFGVVLYEALCGRRPFQGRTGAEIIEAKRSVSAPRIRDVAPHAPRELATLCEDLLARDPIERPGESEILARLEGRSTATATRPDLRPSVDVDLIGRREPLTALRASLARARAGHAEVVLLHSRAGMGKTKLVDHFLDEIAKRGDTLVLSGRCYERESVPYKALDDLVDALGRHLATRSVADLMKLLPPDLGALTEAFPVLLRVRSIAVLVADEGERPREVTRGALRALKHVLVALAGERPLLLVVGDIHWGDADSAPLFTELASGDSVPLMVLATFRSEHRERSALLQTISRGARGAGTARVEDVALGPLSPVDLERLVRELLGPGVPLSLVEHIATEASGNPRIAVELARHARTTGDLTARTTLESLVRTRAATLGVDARRLLEIMAAAGGPLPARVLEHASGLGEARSKVFAELTMGSFIERRGVAGNERYDVIHDAIRMAMLGELPPVEQQKLHLRIARSIETLAGADLDIHRLARHLFHAWPTFADAPKVFAMCLAAGRAAAASYAYEQAYEHLKRAKKVAEASGIPLQVGFRQLLGDAAARAGRIDSALRAFDSALALSTVPIERAELRAALAKIHLGQLDVASTARESVRGLGELGERTTTTSVVDIVCTIAVLVRAWFEARFGKRRVVDPKAPVVDPKAAAVAGDDLEERRVRALGSLRTYGALAAWFTMDPIGQLHSLVRLVPLARSPGALRELTTAAAAGSAFATFVKLNTLAARLARAAARMAGELDDPLVNARVEGYRGHTANFAGRPLEAQGILAGCLETQGPYLENVDYLNCTADLSGILLLRGCAREGLRWVELAVERTSVDGAGGTLVQGHTYYCYGGPLLAMLGRVDEGRRRLDAFGAGIQPKERWRPSQWHAHRALFQVEIGELGASFDEPVAAFRALHASPKRVPLQMRHFYIAQAAGRLAQLDGTKAALARWEEARRELTQAAGTHPALRAHLLCLEASFHAQTGAEDRAEAARAEASALATETDNLLVAWEIAVQRAAVCSRKGDRAEARRHLAEAEATAEREGWTARLARVRALLDA